MLIDIRKEVLSKIFRSAGPYSLYQREDSQIKGRLQAFFIDRLSSIFYILASFFNPIRLLSQGDID